MPIRELGAKARLRVLHFGKQLFAAVGATINGNNALSMRNVVRKAVGRQYNLLVER